MTQVRLQDGTVYWPGMVQPKSRDVLTVQHALYTIIHSFAEWAAVGVSLFTSFIALLLMVPRGVEEIRSGKIDYWKIIQRQTRKVKPQERTLRKLENVEPTVMVKNVTSGQTPVKNEVPQDNQRATSATESQQGLGSPSSTESHQDSRHAPCSSAAPSDKSLTPMVSISPSSTESHQDSSHAPRSPAAPSDKSLTPMVQISPSSTESHQDSSHAPRSPAAPSDKSLTQMVSISPSSTESHQDSSHAPCSPAAPSDKSLTPMVQISPSSAETQQDSSHAPPTPAAPSEKKLTPIVSEISPFRSEPSADASDRVDESQEVVPQLLDEATEETIPSEHVSEQSKN